MTRNEEEAQSMLNSSIALKAEEKEIPKELRWSFLIADCRNLSNADKLHQQLMREIGRNVAEIQNEGLGEHLLRNLNGEINNLIYDKSVLERLIQLYGGPKYAKRFAKMIDLDDNIVDLPNPGVSSLGFGYFGAAAKKLPKARSLFEKPPELRKRRYDKIDANYYGYGDEEHGVLEREEGPAAKKMLREAEDMRREAQEMRHVAEEMRCEAEKMRRMAEEMRREEAKEEKMRRMAEEMRRLQKINKVVLEMKKMELVSEGLLEEQSMAIAIAMVTYLVNLLAKFQFIF